jgi:threonine synthase
MKYISTRDPQKTSYSFSDVLLKGLAEDGGLYVPESYPQLSQDDLTRLRTLPYHELAYDIISRFIGDSIPEQDLRDLLKATYSKAIFGSDAITPLTHLFDNIYVQDLSSGPSLAFKDMAMQFLGHVMEYELKRRGESLTILGASSGDTVSAAEEAMRGKGQITVVMLTPKEGMSPFQKAQAGSILDDNILNVSVPGPFDICQDIVKAVNRDLEFKKTFKIGAVNSINWGRICAQIVYYFNGYFLATSSNEEVVDVVVPSGNFGNVLAAYVAKQMGLPIRRFIVATNENKVLDTFFKTGIYEQQDVVVTSSPSMDISKASNIERFFYDVVGRDAQVLADHMKQFETTKRLDLSQYIEKIQNEIGFSSGPSDHDERKVVIQDVYKKTEEIVDPHTASAIKVALEYRDDSKVPMLCMETAKPTKFESAIDEALGFVPQRPKGFDGLEEKEQRFFDVDATEEAVKQFIREKLS